MQSKLKIEVKDSDSNIEKLVDIGFVGQPTDVNIDLINEHIQSRQNSSHCSFRNR